MKRSSLVLSVIGASVLGCIAFSSTASAVPQEAPNDCVIVYDYCLWYQGHSQAYCEAEYWQCMYGGADSARPATRDPGPVDTNRLPLPD